MAHPHLLYVADPMCSWCWGFASVIDAIQARFGEALPIRLLLGGLRPGTTEPLTEDAKATIREHWDHVQAASGQPFDFGFFAREGFVYDSEPASRAVVIARRAGEDRALAMMKAIQGAFYAANRDVTDPAILARVAEENSLDPRVFAEAFESGEATRETWTDFAIAQRAGIRGFPTLLAGAEEGGAYGMVTQGFQPADRLIPLLERWLAGLQGPAASRS